MEDSNLVQTETPTGSFTIRTHTFEGPLELILELIEKRKLLVNELSLAQVTDDFILHVKRGENFPMEDASMFINVAATLLLIKSRSLLPSIELSHEELGDVDDLTRRLALYELTRNAARDLGRLFGRRIMVARGEREPEVIFAPSRDLTAENIENALRALLSGKGREEKLPEVRIRSLVSIEDMMEKLRTRVERAMSLTFTEFTGTKLERVEVIVSFLALLELVKMGAMEAEQFERWGDIKITNTATSLPRY